MMIDQPEGLVFDLDKTAVENGAITLEDETLTDAIRAVRPGFFLAAATGRSIDYALPLITQLGLTGESLITNGATIIDSQTGEVQWAKWIAEEVVGDMIELFRPYKHQFFMEDDGLDSFNYAGALPPRTTGGAWLKRVPEALALELADVLVEIGPLDVYISDAWGGQPGEKDLNISHNEVNKKSGLIRLFERADVNPDNMIAVGDGMNDISMFELVGHGIAVANAEQPLLKIADEQVASQEDGGLIQVLGRFAA